MHSPIARRDFLKAAPAAASILAVGIQLPEAPPSSESPYPDIGAEHYTPLADYPIRAKRFSDVTVSDTFWKPKIATNAETTIPFEAERTGAEGGGLSGNVLEAAIYSLETHPDEALRAQVRERVAALSRGDGSRRNRSLDNEGFEVAVAWFNATGERTLLDPAIATAEALYEDFKVRKPPFSGGERDAINCLQLYRATHDKKHLDLAKHYLDIRGLPSSVNRSRHNQSYAPVLQQREAVGHAVNCATLMVSLADVGVLTGLRPYLDAAQRIWTDAETRKMYITGGIGSSGNEGFSDAYDLPNISAYSETCAVLMFMTLNHRLFLATGDSKYIDVLERGMYNNALSGVSAAGNRFFYVNRLASAGTGRDERWERASLECCPPNLVRFLATMPGYIYAQDQRDTVYVNLYVASQSTFKVAGNDVSLAIDSEMPWSGRSQITVTANKPTRASIKLRVPGWARNRPAPGSLYAFADALNTPAVVTVNGKSISATPDALGYITVDRTWKTGDSISLELPMDVRKVVADTRVKQDRGRVAIERGPIVYCAEWPDCDGGSALETLIDPRADVKPSVDTSLGSGVTVLNTVARRLTNPRAEARPLRLVPYYLWANRGVGQMSVWLAARELVPGDVGPAGGSIFYVNPNYATDGWRYLEAAPFDQSAGARWGCFRHSIAGARGTAVGAGNQNTADILAACNDAQSAAALCANLSVNGITGWFLPSRDELALMYSNLKATGASDFGVHQADNFSYWASTQATTDMAHHIDFADLGRQHYDDKDYPRRVRAVRAF
jgi:DUF1680 family protein